MQWFCFFAIRSLSRHSGSLQYRRIEYTKLAPLISPPDWARIYGASANWTFTRANAGDTRGKTDWALAAMAIRTLLTSFTRAHAGDSGLIPTGLPCTAIYPRLRG